MGVYLYDCPLEMDNQLGYSSVGNIGSPSFSSLMSSVVPCLETGLHGLPAFHVGIFTDIVQVLFRQSFVKFP